MKKKGYEALKIIEVTERKDDEFKYGISFNAKTENAKHFNKFAEVLGKIRNKKFDVSSNQWCIDEDGLKSFRFLEEKIYSPKKTKTMKEKMASVINITKKSVDNWQAIGSNMKLKPYDYQKQVVKFILDGYDNSHDTLIVAPCGAGKTPMILAAYKESLDRKMISGPGMIVVKASLKTQWAREVKKFTDFVPAVIKTYKDCVSREDSMLKRREKKILSAIDEEKKALEKEIKAIKKEISRKFDAQFNGADLYILNYETLNDEKVREKMLEINPQFIASDESHYIKSSSTKRAKSLYKFNKAKIKIGATATPVQRDPQDIFGIFKFVHPELFPKKKDFAALYVRYGYGFRVIGAKNEKKLNEKISPYMYILTKEEVAEQLPKLSVSQHYCSFSDKQQAINDKVMEELEELAEKEKTMTRGRTELDLKYDQEYLSLQAAIQSRQTFLQELTLSEDLLEESDSDLAKRMITGSANSKLESLKDIVSEIIDSGEKVCIFTRFAKMQPIIDEAIHSVPELKKIEIAHVNGSMNSERRYHEVYEKSRDNENCKVLVMSDAGAEGLNLSHISHIIEMEPAVSYAIQTQRHGRIERADSNYGTVFVTQLIMENSWDEIMLKSIEKKERYDASIVKGEEV